MQGKMEEWLSSRGGVLIVGIANVSLKICLLRFHLACETNRAERSLTRLGRRSHDNINLVYWYTAVGSMQGRMEEWLSSSGGPLIVGTANVGPSLRF